MPRYFFHLDDGLALDHDDEMELPDLVAARATALRYLGQSLADMSPDFWSRGERRLVVSDENRVVLFTLHVTATEASPPQIHILPTPTS